MQSKFRLKLAAMGFAAMGAASAEVGLDVTNVVPIVPSMIQGFAASSSSAQDCWVEHTQVQPPRSRAQTENGAMNAASAKSWAMSDFRLGAEHRHPAERRPCRWQPGRDTAAAGGPMQ